MRHADGELQTLLAESAPPVDLQRVALFRSVCRKQEKKAGTRMTESLHDAVWFAPGPCAD